MLRKSQHWSDLRKNKHKNQHLQNAWNKYGESRFTMVPLENVNTENMYSREAYCISQIDKEFSMNLGPVVGDEIKITATEESRKRYSQARKDYFAGDPANRFKHMAALRKTWEDEEIRASINYSKRHLSPEQANEIRRKRISGMKPQQIANEMNMCRSVIS